MRTTVSLLIASLSFVLAVSLIPGRSQAQKLQSTNIQNGSDLLAAVNSLRGSNGLPAYTANPILMQIAQAQADYMAATGGIYGHAGPDGSTPKQRALAAGYPATFFSENWMAGTGLSPSGAVSAWQGDTPHLTTMLSPSLVEAGAGVSKAGNVTYYVLDAGAQGSSTVAGDTLAPGTNVPAGTPKPSQYMVPVSISTAGTDGLIYHEVAYGQSLWSIAIAYGVKIDSIQALNGLTGLDIYPGQRLLIMLGPTPLPATLTSEGFEAAPAAANTPTTSVAAPTLSFPTLAAPTLISTSPPDTPTKNGPSLAVIAIVSGALLLSALGTLMGIRRSV